MTGLYSEERIARSLSYLVALILVLMPFHEFLAVWLGSHTGHLDLIRIWKEILIVIMILPTLWLSWRSPKLKAWLLKSWIARLYGLYVILHLALGIWALTAHQVNASALLYGLIVNLRFIGFFLICALVAARDDFLKDNWSKILFIPASAVIVFGLLQRSILPYDFLKHFGYGPKTIPAYETVDNNLNYLRIGSTLRGANPLGAYLVIVITASLAWFKTTNIIKPLYSLAGLIVLFYTYSRSAWVGTALALGTLAYLGSRHLRSQVMYIALAAVIVFAGALYELRGHQAIQDALLHTSSSSTSLYSSNSKRSSALKQGVSDIVHQPLGRGPGTAGPASVRNSDHPARIAEDYYLQLGQEIGIIGLAIFTAINYLVALDLWRQRQDALARILLASLVGIAFINLISHAWVDDTLSLLWWGLAGIATAPVILKSKNKRNENHQKKA